MARRNRKEGAFRYLLEAWEPPEGAGEPLGCVATTFRLDPIFFETECLARFVGLGTDAGEDKLQYLLEQEERLSQLMVAAVLVDQHDCRGRRNLRWDLIPARIPGRRLHAKVCLLAWTNCVRVIIGSANLTEDGYRRNLEIFGTLDYLEGGEHPLSVLWETIKFLNDVIRRSVPGWESSAAVGRWRSLLDHVRSRARHWGRDGQRGPIRVYTIFSGLGSPHVLSQAAELWPSGEGSISSAWVVSPFFDPPEAEDRAARALWAILRQRGPAEVHYCVEVDEADGKVHVFAPESLRAATPQGREGVFTAFHRLELDQSRRLHAKGIWLEGERHQLYIVGSSNFTGAGLGLSGAPNIEANLAFVAHFDAREARALEDAFPDYEDIPDEYIVFRPRRNEDETEESEVGLLPPLCQHAQYRRVDTRRELVLCFADSPPSGLAVFTEDDKPLWSAGPDCGPMIVIEWGPDRPPSGLWVQLPGEEQKAWWPVEIDSSSSLPAPEELRDLPLEILVRVLTSARPAYCVISEELARRTGQRAKAGDPELVVDPHAKVDTSTFLLQRSRRMGLAMKVLSQRLAEPVACEAALRWRLEGPVGVDALVRAVLHEGRCTEEKAFLLTDLALSLARVKPASAPGCLPPRRVRQAIEQRIQQIRGHVEALHAGVIPALAAFIERAFEEIQRVALSS